ncbi:MAG: histidine--tRNA ligase [Clostridia bacterium]|nr:histidine--tRNA ligase [Clostridia bacterium]
MMINIPKGTKDVLPSESYKWHYVENTARKIAELFNIKEIRTPTFEHTELFLRGVGDTTDIVNKEMYTFEDKGKRSITLKPEGTAGVARAFIENGLYGGAMPLKTYYITPVFRYERPQAGRLREHHQFGIEFYGSDSADIDAEVILTAYTLLTTLGLQVELNINSMGCKHCRAEYNKALKEFLADNISSMCDTCQERYVKNPLRILDCKEEGCKNLTKNAPKITDYLCDDCSAHFTNLQNCLKVVGLNYKINPYIVRGLDYYTKTVFEFTTNALGAQGTVCGGGRYDGLIEQIGGKSVPGVGFGMGLERVLMLMEAVNAPIPEDNGVTVYIASMGEKAYYKAFELAYALRIKGVSAETDHMNRSFKAQFKYADKIKAKYVIALGDNEIETGDIKIKRMVDGEETHIKLNEVLNFNF